MINPDGYTYVHEHLHIDLSDFKNDLDCRLDQYQLICEEMRELATKGVTNIVEVTSKYMGRNPHFILQLMQDSGINIIVSTGYYIDAFYPSIVRTSTAAQLAKTMIDEIEIGIDDTVLKAGVIAEIGTSEDQITADEAKVFHAAALAHHATGLAISTHTSFSTMGLQQIALLEQHGVPLNRVTIGHCDLKEQLDTILRMIDKGVCIQFDTIGKNNYFPDERRVAMLTNLAERGLLDRVMLSLDITRRSHLKRNGGNGFSYLIDSFIPMLLVAGISPSQIEMMLRHNPNKFFRSREGY